MALTKATQAVIAVDICTTDTAQTITGVKTFTNAISAPNMVTTDTAQTITGVKTISNDTLINGLTVGKGGGNIASNTASGAGALGSNTTGSDSVAIGSFALSLNTTAQNNTAIGQSALRNNNGNNNTACGNDALRANTTGINNTAVGQGALVLNTTGGSNVAIGASLIANTTGGSNVAIGLNALNSNVIGNFNTALGREALESNSGSSNSSGLGYLADVTGSNQVQLGNGATTTFAYGAVQNRSDIRDKADIRDTTLGLEFVNALRPVDFKWDYREDYRAKAPKTPEQDATEEEKSAYKVAKAKWLEDVKLANITHDGSKKRTRFHHGLIAQEVKAVLDAKGIDFGGFQDHSVKGGDDVLSIGYEELIAPLIKAVQELSAEVAALKAK
jgi:hypothetical protein